VTDTLPEDWVLIEAAKRCNIHGGQISGLQSRYQANSDPFRALCDMILKHEQPPVDRKLLCARQALCQRSGYGGKNYAEVTSGKHDEIFDEDLTLCVRAIELWEEGFGK
jgi:hypothetical protein